MMKQYLGDHECRDPECKLQGLPMYFQAEPEPRAWPWVLVLAVCFVGFWTGVALGVASLV